MESKVAEETELGIMEILKDRMKLQEEVELLKLKIEKIKLTEELSIAMAEEEFRLSKLNK